MKAVRLHAPGDLRVHDEPMPTCANGDVLLRVRSVGLCGSDRHWFQEGRIGGAAVSSPLVLGHEILAVVEKGAQAGMRVAVDPAVPCGTCVTCSRGDSHLCPNGTFAGHGIADGGLRTFMAWPSELCHPVPELLSDDEAVLLEPLGVALHALDLGQVRAGISVGVFGCGPIGQLLVQLLVAADVKTVAVSEPLPHRLESTLTIGDPVRAISPGACSEIDLDVAFEVSGEDDALADALAALRPGGRVVVVGIPDGDQTSFRASTARRKGVTMLLSRRMRPDDLPRAIRVAVEGTVRLGGLVSERYSLDAAPDAFRALAAYRGTKIVVADD